MAWVEQTGENSWRVRFRRDDRTIGNVTGFTSEGDAENYAQDLESDQRRGNWIDPTAGQLLVSEFMPDWLEALDVDTRTEENYRGILCNHIEPRWGETALVLQRQLGEWVAASFVVAETGLVLSSTAEA
jgi:hypothetical protein